MQMWGVPSGKAAWNAPSRIWPPDGHVQGPSPWGHEVPEQAMLNRAQRGGPPHEPLEDEIEGSWEPVNRRKSKRFRGRESARGEEGGWKSEDVRFNYWSLLDRRGRKERKSALSEKGASRSANGGGAGDGLLCDAM